MLLACALLAGSNAHSGVSDLWPALLLKGLAVGILNITLTVHILRSFSKHCFPKHQVAEGITWFYLFRNFGSLLAITEFSRLMYIETLGSVSKLAENYNASSETFVLHQQMTADLLKQGIINPSPEQIALLLSGQLKTQAMSVAGVNNFQWIIFSIILLVPIIVIAMKWANNQPHHKDNESEVH